MTDDEVNQVTQITEVRIYLCIIFIIIEEKIIVKETVLAVALYLFIFVAPLLQY